MTTGKPDDAAQSAQRRREHQEAVDALRAAEDAYRQAIAGSAFLSSTEDPSAVEVQQEALNRLEEARRRLDEVRQQEQK